VAPLVARLAGGSRHSGSASRFPYMVQRLGCPLKRVKSTRRPRVRRSPFHCLRRTRTGQRRFEVLFLDRRQRRQTSKPLVEHLFTAEFILLITMGYITP
jgi:hypothetical protein